MAREENTELVAVEQHEQERQEKSWSDLPECVLGLVLSRLIAGDRVCFRSVCKWWRSTYISDKYLTARQPPRLVKNPLFSLDSPSLICLDGRVFHPFMSSQFYQVDFMHRHPDTVVHAAKYGWLLITQACKRLITQASRRIFFYNPFTKTTINLPDISYEPVSVDFSCEPTSEDCFVILASTTLGIDLDIYTIRCGEDWWTYHPFDSCEDFRYDLAPCNPVVYNGLYYFLLRRGNIMIYHPKTVKVSFIGKTYELYACGCERYFFGRHRELYAVFMAFDGSWIHVRRMNLLHKVWMPMYNLGDQMIYLSLPSVLCETATLSGTSNKIYFPRFIDNNMLFYSLATKSYHTFEIGVSKKIFNRSKEMLHCAWIKPPAGLISG